MVAFRLPRGRGPLREAPRFRYLWFSRSISATGSGAGRVALVLLVAPSGPGTVSLVLLCTAVPQVLGPLAGTLADRMDQRRLLACCEAGQGVIYALIAAGRPPLFLLLPLVAAAGTLAALMSPAGKGSVPRLVPAAQLPQANALLGLAFNLQVVAGPVIGGALAGLAGLTAAFALNAASFFASALLLTRLGPLPPQPGTAPGGIWSEARAGLAYAARNPVLRALVLGTGVFVSFAAADNVALVFLIRHSLHGSAAGYGAATAGFGAGMVAASVILAGWANRRPAAYWLIGGVSLSAAGTAATGLAPRSRHRLRSPGPGGGGQHRRPGRHRHADPADSARGTARPRLRSGLRCRPAGLRDRLFRRGPARLAHRTARHVPHRGHRYARRTGYPRTRPDERA